MDFKWNENRFKEEIITQWYQEKLKFYCSLSNVTMEYQHIFEQLSCNTDDGNDIAMQIIYILKNTEMYSLTPK